MRSRPGARRALQVVAALVAVMATRIALACPACANRDEGGPALFSVYATMVIAPFFAVAIAWRVIRSLTGAAGQTAQSATRSIHINHSTRDVP